MTKKADLNQISSRHYDSELWAGIRTVYESKSQPNYKKIKSILSAEFKLDTFPSQRTVERHAAKERWIRFKDEITNKVTPNKYSDDFWLCVRRVYESNPKTPYKQFKELVQNEQKSNDFPSQQAIAYRAKHEGWERSDSLLKKSDATLKKLIRSVKKIESENDFKVYLINKENYKNQNLGCGYAVGGVYDFDFIKEIAKCEKVNIKNLLMTAQVRRKRQADIIVKSRKRMVLNNDLGDQLSDSLVIIYALLISDKVGRTFTKPMMTKLKNQLNTLCQISEAYNNLSFNKRESIKFELSLYGTQLEDLKDRDDARRANDLNNDKAYEAQQLRLDSQKEKLAARRRYIDSGGLEEEINTELERLMEEVKSDEGDVD